MVIQISIQHQNYHTLLWQYTANEVMAIVQSLATRGLTVVATIHSPTPYSFHLCDRLLFLMAGNVVYFGKNGEECNRDVYIHACE